MFAWSLGGEGVTNLLFSTHDDATGPPLRDASNGTAGEGEIACAGGGLRQASLGRACACVFDGW